MDVVRDRGKRLRIGVIGTLVVVGAAGAVIVVQLGRASREGFSAGIAPLIFAVVVLAICLPVVWLSAGLRSTLVRADGQTLSIGSGGPQPTRLAWDRVERVELRPDRLSVLADGFEHAVPHDPQDADQIRAIVERHAPATVRVSTAADDH